MNDFKLFMNKRQSLKSTLLIITLFYFFQPDNLQAQHGTAGNSIRIPYPQPLAGYQSIPFLPGIVSKDSIDFGSAFSPDGKSFYFSRSENKRSHIYVTHHDGQRWVEPVSDPFSNENYSDADPAFAPDGKLYFISDRPTSKKDKLQDYNIWSVIPLSNGKWSAPENVQRVNTDSNEYYISFSGNGNMYFSSSRKGGFGEEDIYISRLVNGQYQDPENLGPIINTAYSEYDPGISANEGIIVFASSNRPDGFGKADLYSSKSNGDKTWLRPINMGATFNTATREYCPYFSPDGRYFFYSSEGNVKWIGMEALTLRLSK